MPTRVLASVAAGLGSGVTALAGLVATAGDVPGEQRALVALSSTDALDPVARVVDDWTGYLPVAAFTALLVVTLVRLGRRRDGVLAAVSVAGAQVGNALLKRLVDRPRPELLSPVEDVSALSFPSGHAAATAALAVVIVLTTRGTRWSLPAALAASLLVVVTAAAQLVLGLHHPSDVVAGWLWGAAWTTAVWAAWRVRVNREAGRRP